MNYLDIIIVVLLLWSAYKGFTKGFIIEVASLVALFLGVWGGVHLSYITADYLAPYLEVSKPLMRIVSFALTFIIIVILVFLLGKVIEKLVKMVALGLVNKLAGLFFGVLKTLLIISLVLYLINGLNTDFHFMSEKTQKGSFFYKPLSKIAPTIIPSINQMRKDSLF